MRPRQRQLGATEPDEVIPAGLPVVGQPTTLAEFAGWSGDDIFAWLEQVGQGLRRVREGVGLALLALRDATPSDVEYGARVERLAALYDVHRGTLWRWREQARTAMGAPPSGRAKRATSQRALPPATTRGAVPDLGSGGEASADSVEHLVHSPQEPPPAPTAVDVAPDPPNGAQGRLEAPAGPVDAPSSGVRPVTVTRALDLIAVCSTEELRAAGHVRVRDAVDRLALADGRKLILPELLEALQANLAVTAAGALVPSAAPAGSGKTPTTPPTSTPAGTPPCDHPAGKRTVSGSGMVGCGKCGAHKVGNRWV